MESKKKVTVEPWIERDRLIWACPTIKNKITSGRERKKNNQYLQCISTPCLVHCSVKCSMGNTLLR